MIKINIQDISTKYYTDVVFVNSEEVQHTSEMNNNTLKKLIEISSFSKIAIVDGNVAGFILVISENQPYDNENYRWFSNRYSQFLYVDRIVVNSKYRGLNIGSALYKTLFEFAKSIKTSIITCEINSIPPNEISGKFHERNGFIEVGTQWIKNNTKKVSMQMFEIKEKP